MWILQNGEEIPSDPGPPRLLRQCLLAETLAARGHEVRYWTGTFNHQQKLQRSRTVATFEETGGYLVTLLPARAYTGHVTPQRIMSHRQAAAGFRKMAARLEPPDILISGYPTIELAFSGVQYASDRGIPSIVDFRDQWPDIIRDRLPPHLRVAAAPLLRRWSRMQRLVVRRATSVVGISDEFVSWALAAGHRPRGDLDRAFHLAPPVPALTPQQLSEARAFWGQLLGTKGGDQVWGVYAGNLSSRTDIATVAEATRHIPPDVAARLKIIVCGSGESEAPLREIARDNPALEVAGQRNAAEVQWLLEAADFGIVPYLDSSDFLMSYPNKLGEQLSHGLPILTGLGGVTGRLLDERRLRIAYTSTDAASCAQSLAAVVRGGITADQRSAARATFSEQFNPRAIYPAYADHVERVARINSAAPTTRHQAGS